MFTHDPEEGDTPLHAAVKDKEMDIGIIEDLLRRGEDPDVLNGEGYAPLHYAATHPNSDPRVIRKLVEDYGANVNTRGRGSFRKTPLLHCLLNISCRQDVALELMRCGAYVGGPTLYLALVDESFNSNFVSELIRYGADVNSTIGHNSKTPLHVAACYMRLDMVQELLRNGANVHAQDIHGRTALHAVLYWHNENNTDVLVKIVKELVENEANPNALDNDDCTPLITYCHLHSLRDGLEVVKTLLNLGADVNMSAGLNGITALEACLKHRDLNLLMIQELLQRGAALDKEKMLPFIEYIKEKSNTEFYQPSSPVAAPYECVMLLIKYNILNCQDYFECISSKGVDECMPLEEFRGYTLACISELMDAKSMDVFENVSLYKVLREKSLKYELSTNGEFLYLGLNKLLSLLAEKKFPNYSDIIASMLIFERKFLIHKIMELSLTKGFFGVSNAAVGSISLNLQCVYDITTYLSGNDLLSLILSHFDCPMSVM